MRVKCMESAGCCTPCTDKHHRQLAPALRRCTAWASIAAKALNVFTGHPLGMLAGERILSITHEDGELLVCFRKQGLLLD